MHPLMPSGPMDEQPEGLSYSGVLVRARREDVLRQLADLRFSGWLGPQEGDWVGVVPLAETGPVAAGRMELEGLGAQLAQRLESTAISASVLSDRVLRLSAWDGPESLLRYVSDPSFGLPDAEDVFPEPEGVEGAPALATRLGRPECSDEIVERLSEVLDEDSEIESERLASVLSMLELPRWMVAASSLPRDVPGGPGAKEFLRLGGGRVGMAGLAGAWAFRLRRRATRRRGAAQTA
ncbi:MAG: hypothetical protein M3Q27_16210 [Actinomycetota bacterium]|nr:hypothetical protein [Actinomycetota bacterium]